MKGNTDCHIPNKKYRDNYDNIFSKEKKKEEEDKKEAVKRR